MKGIPNMKIKQKNIAGITLIALVITIIVLLILAGISINMLSGENSILKQAGEARNKTELEQDTEIIKRAYNSALKNNSSKYDNQLTEEELSNALKSYDAGAKVTLVGEVYKITLSNGHRYFMSNDEKIINYSDAPYAVNELTVEVSGNTVESQYYINYPSAKGNIRCRVLYNDSTYGLQVISTNSVEKVKIGKNDPSDKITGTMGSIERCINSYNRAILTLNEKAEEYVETSTGEVLATDARCIGSDPNFSNKNYPDNLTGTEREEQMIEIVSGTKVFKPNDIWLTYNTRFYNLNGRTTNIANGDWYYYARRHNFVADNKGYFCISIINGNNGTNNNWGNYSSKFFRSVRKSR